MTIDIDWQKIDGIETVLLPVCLRLDREHLFEDRRGMGLLRKHPRGPLPQTGPGC